MMVYTIEFYANIILIHFYYTFFFIISSIAKIIDTKIYVAKK